METSPEIPILRAVKITMKIHVHYSRYFIYNPLRRKQFGFQAIDKPSAKPCVTIEIN